MHIKTLTILLMPGAVGQFLTLLSHAHVHLSRRLQSSWNWSELESTCIDLLLLKGVH